MHKNEPKQESNQATLARVKREMDERAWPNPRGKKTSTRPAAGAGKAAIIQRGKESRAVRAQGMLPREENNGKANQAGS